MTNIQKTKVTVVTPGNSCTNLITFSDIHIGSWFYFSPWGNTRRELYLKTNEISNEKFNALLYSGGGLISVVFSSNELKEYIIVNSIEISVK